jgi:hypothetical protein
MSTITPKFAVNSHQNTHSHLVLVTDDSRSWANVDGGKASLKDARTGDVINWDVGPKVLDDKQKLRVRLDNPKGAKEGKVLPPSGTGTLVVTLTVGSSTLPDVSIPDVTYSDDAGG